MATKPIEAPIDYRRQIIDRIEELGLSKQTSDLDEKGYTVVNDVAPEGFIDELREKSEALIDGGNGLQAAMLLKRGRVFEQAVLNEKIVALAEYMVGKGCIISQVTTIAKSSVESDELSQMSIALHSDYALIRDSFPPYPLLITAVWALEDWGEGSGGSVVIPGTHTLRRHYDPDRDGDDVVQIHCPKGSVALWDGAVFHGNCDRTVPDRRITLHVTYNRVFMRTFEDYSDISKEILDRNPPEFAALLGHDDPFGKNNFNGAWRKKLERSRQWYRT